jgi:acetyl/propionyl-CoA carboxylase alpha subunit
MTFDVEINGRSRTVSVERGGQGRYRVTIDGRVCEIDAVRVGAFGLSLLLDAASGASRTVQVIVVVEAMKMENELRAPKAGRVKDVAVESGASVEAGRVLVVIE